MTQLRFRTNAKINLFLRVEGKRSDGFHSIETIFQSVSLGDLLLAESADGAFRVEMTGALGGAGLPRPEDNIATRAAEALRVASGSSAGAKVTIEKRIPAAAGLAGGSANAAGTLVALQELWGTDADLSSLAAGLGSDVPFCLLGGTALATGKGEVLQPLAAPSPIWMVLGISAEPLATAAVYEEWRPGDQGDRSGSETRAALGAGDVPALAQGLRNDLEHPAFRLRPDLPPLKEALLDAGALGACLSGSGPTLFGLAADEGHAAELAERSRGNFDRVEVVCSTRACVARDGLDS